MLDERFAGILSRVADLGPGFVIAGSQNLQADLGIDSLKLIDIVLEVEREFGIELSEDAIAQIKTVSALWDEISRGRAVLRNSAAA